MKRSEINKLQRQAMTFLSERKFHLPPWAFWNKNDWEQHQDRATEIMECGLGWDLTDFGSGDFYHTGLILFTLRNGRSGIKNGKSYAEKIMIIREEQVTPWHFHWHKMEDIINRGGGNLVLELYNSTKDEQLANTAIRVQIDGIMHTIDPGGKVVLGPGESITLPPYLYHSFYGEKGEGTVLVGEVSKVNDDATDNRFLEPVGRFPEIVEDEPLLYCLCHEYPV